MTVDKCDVRSIIAIMSREASMQVTQCSDVDCLRDGIGQESVITEILCLLLVFAPLAPTYHDLGVAAQTVGGDVGHGSSFTFSGVCMCCLYLVACL